jgi:transcription factor E
MQVKLLHDFVEEMVGNGTGKIVEILFGKKDVNEFLIAKKMNMTINQVRNILYKLSAEGLVSFVRKKDKRKGWYIYFWTLNTEKCLVKLEQNLIKKIEEYKAILSNRESKRFYVCKSCGIEVNEAKALENGFVCDECAEVYELSENKEVIRDTKTKITKVEKELKLIQEELEKYRKKESDKKKRQEKKSPKKEKKKSVKKKIKKSEKPTKKKTKKITKKNLKTKKKITKKTKKK